MTALRLKWVEGRHSTTANACGLFLTVHWIDGTQGWGAAVSTLKAQAGFQSETAAQQWAESWLLNFALNLVTTLQPPVIVKKGG